MPASSVQPSSRPQQRSEQWLVNDRVRVRANSVEEARRYLPQLATTYVEWRLDGSDGTGYYFTVRRSSDSDSRHRDAGRDLADLARRDASRGMSTGHVAARSHASTARTSSSRRADSRRDVMEHPNELRAHDASELPKPPVGFQWSWSGRSRTDPSTSWFHLSAPE